jgi:hypothetical protein
MNEDKIIHLCQVVSAWVTKRGEAYIRREKGVFDKCDQEVSKWIKELKDRVKNDTE